MCLHVFYFVFYLLFCTHSGFLKVGCLSVTMDFWRMFGRFICVICFMLFNAITYSAKKKNQLLAFVNFFFLYKRKLFFLEKKWILHYTIQFKTCLHQTKESAKLVSIFCEAINNSIMRPNSFKHVHKRYN